MIYASSPTPQPESSSKQRLRPKRLLVLIVDVLAMYLLAAYIVGPLAWKRYVHRHPMSSMISTRFGKARMAAATPGKLTADYLWALSRLGSSGLAWG
jgi:hypothetical protein